MSVTREHAIIDQFSDTFNQFGSIRRFTSEGGDEVLVLPACQVPDSYLNKNRWSIISEMGNVRSVRLIEALDDGDRPGIVVKSPERVFTTEKMQIERGEVWWGGKRSGERAIKLSGPTIEEQSIWEAAVLLELIRNGFHAEAPQAIIENSRRQLALVVKEVQTSYTLDVSGNKINYEELLDDVRRTTSLIPRDSTGFNSIRDLDGNINIIDVNRWLWIPHTNSYRNGLVKFVANSVQERARVA